MKRINNTYLIIILLQFFPLTIKAQVKALEIFVEQVTGKQNVYKYELSGSSIFEIKDSDRWKFSLNDWGRTVPSVLDSVPLSDEQAKQVEFIKLRCSVIRDSLPIMAQRFPNLRTLYIESNYIGDLKGLFSFKKLESLIISRQSDIYLSYAPPSHYSYCNLKEISKLDSLKYLYITGFGSSDGISMLSYPYNDIYVSFDLEEIFNLKKLQKVTGYCFPLETMLKMPWVKEFGYGWAPVDCFLFLKFKYGKNLDIKEVEEKYPILACKVYDKEKKKFLFTTKDSITANSTFTIYSLDKKAIMKGTYKNGQRDGIWIYNDEDKRDGYNYKSNNESIYKNGIYIKGTQLNKPKDLNVCFDSQEFSFSIETHKFSDGYSIIKKEKVTSCNKNNSVNKKQKNITEKIKTDTIICVKTNDKFYMKTSGIDSTVLKPDTRINKNYPLQHKNIIYSVYDFAKPMKYEIIIDDNKMIYNLSSNIMDYVGVGNDTTVRFTQNKIIDGKVNDQTYCECSTHGFPINYKPKKYKSENDIKLMTCRNIYGYDSADGKYSPYQLQVETCNDCKVIIYDKRKQEINTLEKIFLPYERHLKTK